MAKDPAFLFYSESFLTGVMTMTFEDRGKYITLLALMHQQGRMKDETIRFLVGSVSDTLRSKFRIDENGFWYNQKLEEETAKRAKFAESRRENGKKGGRKPIGSPYGLPNGLPNDQPTNNLPINRNIDKNEDEETGKGVQGEGDPLNDMEIGQAQQYVYITAQRNYTAKQILAYWDAYLIHSQGTTHGGRNRQLQHFRNWLKLQPNEKSVRNHSRLREDPSTPGTYREPL